MEKTQQLIGQEPQKKIKVDETIPLPAKNDSEPSSELDQLRAHSIVVADTSDFSLLQQYLPEDSTTNPTLILQAAKNPAYAKLIDESIDFGLKNFQNYQGGKKKKEILPVKWNELDEWQQQQLIELIYDHLFVSFGQKILEKVKGYVSTEIDATLSFNKNETVKRAKRIISLYSDAGVDTNRVLVKIATTWEGIEAAKTLLKSKIKCNMTLVFHKIQAIACAKAKLFLISPFVGRILDWNKKESGKTEYLPHQDPGVQSVTEIYNYFKKFDINTIVMGASFRNTGEIKQLCGCDRLTISPKLLEELKTSKTEVSVKLSSEKAKTLDIEEIHVDEATFRYEMNKSKMATDLLSAGIRSFEKDGNDLKEMIRKRVLELQTSNVDESKKPGEQSKKPQEQSKKPQEQKKKIEEEKKNE